MCDYQSFRQLSSPQVVEDFSDTGQLDLGHYIHPRQLRSIDIETAFVKAYEQMEEFNRAMERAHAVAVRRQQRIQDVLQECSRVAAALRGAVCHRHFNPISSCPGCLDILDYGMFVCTTNPRITDHFFTRSLL